MTTARATLIPALLAPPAAPVPGFPATGGVATFSTSLAALLVRSVSVPPTVVPVPRAG